MLWYARCRWLIVAAAMGANLPVRLRVAKGVKRLRRLRGWSQEQLAEQVGNTEKHISQIERGKVNVGIDVLASIAKSAVPTDYPGSAPLPTTPRDDAGVSAAQAR